MITWKEGLKTFYSLWMYSHIQTKENNLYSKSFFIKLYLQSDNVLSRFKQRTTRFLLIQNHCSYCNKPIESWNGEGDHPLPELKKMGIDMYNIPCCKTCNSSKNDTEMFKWFFKTKGELHSIRPDVIINYLKALWFVKKEKKELGKEVGGWFVKYLDILKREIDYEVVENIQTYEKKQISMFEILGTTPDEWTELPYTDIINYGEYEYPVYGILPSHYKIVRPYYDIKPEQYALHNDGHSCNCQLCGAKIKHCFMLQHKEKKLLLEIGIICNDTYYAAKGETMKRIKLEYFLKYMRPWKSRILSQTWKERQEGEYFESAKWIFINFLREDLESKTFKQLLGLLRRGENLGYEPPEQLTNIIHKRENV